MRHRVAGLPLDAFSVEQLHERLLDAIRTGSRARVLSLNAHGVVIAHAQGNRMRSDLEEAEIVFCDGAGMRVAALLAGIYIPPRITYADWTWQFADFSARNGLRWFLLGGVPGRADAAASALRARIPTLDICGTHHGYFDQSPGSAENASVIARINASHPDVLIVGFGMPIQERWVTENWPSLRVGVALTGGAVLDYVSGALRRPPLLLRKTGFEWLGRMLVEPRRLWRRYVFGLPQFAAIAMWFGLRSWAMRARTLLTRA